MGRRPAAPGTADQRNTKDPWKFADGEGWQHGDIPAPPDGLTAAGVEAWNTWLGSWWACFYSLEDLPGLVLTVKTYDGALAGHVDSSKAIPLLDRYGITPEGRFRLRWAKVPVKTDPGAAGDDQADVDLAAMTKKELLAFAAERDVEVNPRSKVAELREILAGQLEPVDEVTARRQARAQRMA